jgi:hypothetical protein
LGSKKSDLNIVHGHLLLQLRNDAEQEFGTISVHLLDEGVCGANSIKVTTSLFIFVLGVLILVWMLDDGVCEILADRSN